MMFLAQLCLQPPMCKSQHLWSGKGAPGGGCCLSTGVVRDQRKRMLDPLGPAQSFEVISGWRPALSSLTTRWLHQNSISSRQMCRSATTTDICLVDRALHRFWHPSFLGGVSNVGTPQCNTLLCARGGILMYRPLLK